MINRDDSDTVGDEVLSTSASEETSERRSKEAGEAKRLDDLLSRAGFTSTERETLLGSGLFSTALSPRLVAEVAREQKLSPEQVREFDRFDDSPERGKLRRFLLHHRRAQMLGRETSVSAARGFRRKVVLYFDRLTSMSYYKIGESEAVGRLVDASILMSFLAVLLNGDGTRGDWDFLRDVTKRLQTQPIQQARADVVFQVAEALRRLYAELPPTPQSVRIEYPKGAPHRRTIEGWNPGRPSRNDADPDDLETEAYELRSSLQGAHASFENVSLARVKDLLARAAPSQPKALGAPYIAAVLSLESGAFSDAHESGEPLEEAARRLSNVFRNAASKSRT